MCYWHFVQFLSFQKNEKFWKFVKFLKICARIPKICKKLKHVERVKILDLEKVPRTCRMKDGYLFRVKMFKFAQNIELKLL